MEFCLTFSVVSLYVVCLGSTIETLSVKKKVRRDGFSIFNLDFGLSLLRQVDSNGFLIEFVLKWAGSHFCYS